MCQMLAEQPRSFYLKDETPERKETYDLNIFVFKLNTSYTRMTFSFLGLLTKVTVRFNLGK